MWNIARNNSKKSREMNLRQPKENKGKFNLLQNGTPVFIYLGPKGNKKVEATVLRDNGVSVRVQKSGPRSRFNVITVHKSRVAKRIENSNITLQTILEDLDFQERGKKFSNNSNFLIENM